MDEELKELLLYFAECKDLPLFTQQFFLRVEIKVSVTDSGRCFSCQFGIDPQE